MTPAHLGDDGRPLGTPPGNPPVRATGTAAADWSAAASRDGLAGELVDWRLAEQRPEPRALARRRALTVLALMRPGQWVKNVLVIAAPAAAGVLLRDDVPLRVALAFVGFCLLSGATYIVNDLRDAREDRNHPRKRHRPIAAGRLEPRAALLAAGALMLAGLGTCLIARPLLAVVGAAYLAVSISYTLVWRRIMFADIGAIAAGFVLRAVAGGAAAPVVLSRSFLLVVTFAAIFVATGKRHAELAQPHFPAGAGRRVLRAYTARQLRAVMVASALAAFAAYCVWALAPNRTPGFGWREATVIPFAACLVRYGVQLRRGAGEAPELLLVEDRLLQLLALCWTVVFALSVHAAS